MPPTRPRVVALCLDILIYRVNPPLVRMVAALPSLAAGAETDYSSHAQGIGVRAEFAVMDDFIGANGERVIWLVTLARWALIPLALLGGYVCYRWARELYGDTSGVLALTLWCFCPNVLAYAQILTADAGATAVGVTASYLFWKWLRDPAWERALVAGVVLGLAELTKTTWAVLFGLWPALWICWEVSGWWTKKASGSCERAGESGSDGRAIVVSPSERNSTPRRLALPAPHGWRLRTAQLVTIVALALVCLNAGYDFEGSGTKLGDYLFVSRPLTGARDGHWAGRFGNRFARTWLASMPVPLPRNYVEGIDLQWHDIEIGKPSYLRGRWQERGWWYWYLYALAVKVPLGTWGLFLLTIGIRLVSWRAYRRHHAPRDGRHAERDDYGGLRHAERDDYDGVHGSRKTGATFRDELILLGPAAAVLVLVSSQTGFSRYVRYVLPALPFVFIWVSSVARWAWPAAQPTPAGAWYERRWRPVIVGALLAWSVGSSLWYAPHWMSYFNELAGGPRGGPAHLIDAQVDWGQDLLYLKKWLAAHPEARPLGVVYFGPINPALAGIDFVLPPKGNLTGDDRMEVAGLPDDLKPGWYAVSVNYLYGYPHYMYDERGGREWVNRPYYSYFRRFEPVATAGYSIYIYHLTARDIEATSHNRRRHDGDAQRRDNHGDLGRI